MLAYSQHYSALAKCLTTARLRQYSSNRMRYNEKVFVVPFGFDKRGAILETFLHACNLTTPVDIPVSDHIKRFRVFFNNFDPDRQTTPITPLRIQPLYFPTWRVEAEALNVNISTNDIDNLSTARSTGYLLSRNLYHPGHHMFPLSALGFVPFEDSPILPWSESLARLDDGTDIVCLPYTLSPLKFADIMREFLTQTEASKADQSTLFSVHVGPIHPVLIPLYLVQYDVIPSNSGYKPDPLTIIIEGHKEGGALFAGKISDLYLHPSMSLIARAVLSGLKYKGDLALDAKEEPSSFISVYRRDLPVNVWEYTGHMTNSPLQAEQLRLQLLHNWQQNPQNIDWNDIRIQSSTLENRIRIETFQTVKMTLVHEHIKELLQQQGMRQGDLAAVHTFLYNIDGGEELRKTQPSWYYESLRRNTTMVKSNTE